MNFRRFLVEMETTADEKDRLRTIIEKLIQGDQKWFDDKIILVGNKGQYWVLNYMPGPSNEYNKLTRGLIVRKPQPGFNQDLLSLIESFPFIRFFNQHEGEADQVNLANAEMLEKLDGTFVGVFFPTRDPHKPQWQTRKMISTHKKDIQMMIPSFKGKKFKLLSLIGGYVKKLPFTDKDVNYTFMFEFIHEASQVVTKYGADQYGLYLIGARNIDTHRELTEQELDRVAARLGVKRPRRWHTTGEKSQIEDLMQQAKAGTQDFEGFIFRDKDTGKRIKVKDLEYLKKHRMLDSVKTIANFLPLVLQGEESEILAYFPNLGKVVDEIKTTYNAFIDKAVKKVKHWQAKGLSKKDLATTLFGKQPMSKWELRLAKMRGEPVMVSKAEPDPFMRQLIMKYYEVLDENELRRELDAQLKKIGLGDGHNEGSPKKLVDILGLADKNIIEDPGEV